MKAWGLPPTACATQTAWWRNARLPAYHDNKARSHTSRHCYLHSAQTQTPKPQGGAEGGASTYARKRMGRRRMTLSPSRPAHTKAFPCCSSYYGDALDHRQIRSKKHTTNTVWLAALFSHSSYQFGLKSSHVMRQDPLTKLISSLRVWSIQHTSLAKPWLVKHPSTSPWSSWFLIINRLITKVRITERPKTQAIVWMKRSSKTENAQVARKW